MFEHIDRYQTMERIDKVKARRREKRAVKQRITGEHVDTSDLYLMDDDIRELRKNVNPTFEKKFRKGYISYIKGDWALAEGVFAQCLKLDPGDGPTMTLKKYISEQHLGIAPKTWKGYRELTEK